MSIYIALGANLQSPAGSPRRTLDAALDRLAARGLVATQRSRWYRSAAWPPSDQPDYVNGVAAVAPANAEAPATPSAVLAALHAVETEFGRHRGANDIRNAARALDLDLLDFRGLVDAGGAGAPVLPHPRLHLRAFVLLPLAEIAPLWRHPVSRRTIADLIVDLDPELRAEPLG